MPYNQTGGRYNPRYPIDRARDGSRSPTFSQGLPSYAQATGPGSSRPTLQTCESRSFQDLREELRQARRSVATQVIRAEACEPRLDVVAEQLDEKTWLTRELDRKLAEKTRLMEEMESLIVGDGAPTPELLLQLEHTRQRLAAVENQKRTALEELELEKKGRNRVEVSCFREVNELE